jgi:hypothetical protein
MHGRWPNKRAGNIEGQQGLTWATVNQALSQGLAGLPGGSSLSRLLGDETGVRTARHKRQLTELAIVVWADAFHARQGRWPTRRSGPVEGRPDLTWELIHTALRVGRHGLAGGSSLAELLRVQRRARRRKTELPPLDAGQILAWADAYHARHGRWPSIDSGPVDGVPRETWSTVAAALCFGLRGLPDGGSLVELLADHLTSPG